MLPETGGDKSITLYEAEDDTLTHWRKVKKLKEDNEPWYDSVIHKKDGKYYFMWSEGGWTTSNYCVAYAISDSLFGPFKRIGKVIEPDPNVGKGAGHHSVLHAPSGKWYAIYHRRPLTERDGNSRATCIDEMKFNDDGTIAPVKLTFEGVKADPAK